MRSVGSWGLGEAGLNGKDGKLPQSGFSEKGKFMGSVTKRMRPKLSVTTQFPSVSGLRSPPVLEGYHALHSSSFLASQTSECVPMAEKLLEEFQSPVGLGPMPAASQPLAGAGGGLGVGRLRPESQVLPLDGAGTWFFLTVHLESPVLGLLLQ